jgi:hypothetical protein
MESDIVYSAESQSTPYICRVLNSRLHDVMISMEEIVLCPVFGCFVLSKLIEVVVLSIQLSLEFRFIFVDRINNELERLLERS